MLKTIKLRKIGKSIGISRWNDVQIHKGYDTGGFYVDVLQSENNDHVEIICANIATSEDERKIDALFTGYKRALKKMQSAS